jgi:hypothetical protein
MAYGIHRSVPDGSPAHSPELQLIYETAPIGLAFLSDQIVKAGHRITELIDGIRAMFGKDSAKTSVVNLRQLVGEVLALTQGELETHQILLRNDIDDGFRQ